MIYCLSNLITVRMQRRKYVIKRIHVNQPNIRANLKDGGNRPVISVVTYKGTQHTQRATIHGPSTIEYSGDGSPLSCGARVWVETKAEVTLE